MRSTKAKALLRNDAPKVLNGANGANGDAAEPLNGEKRNQKLAIAWRRKKHKKPCLCLSLIM